MPKRLNLLFSFGRPFSPVYGLVMKVREHLYERGVFRRHRLPVPVLSVGNLVLGGTGKTPIVVYLAEFLRQRGYRPAIISRGYGGKAAERVNVVADGERILLGPRLAGDEPYMLSRLLPGVPVLTGRRRIYPCRYAVEAVHADILILDDGFQHLAVQRTLDLVLFDGSTLAGNSRVFPGGILREPVSALHRSSAFLLTGINEKCRKKAELFGELLTSRFPGKPVFFSTVGHFTLKRLEESAGPPGGEKIFFGFCGIANPDRFHESLKMLGLRLAGFLALPDHAGYRQTLVDNIGRQACRAGATHLVTTEKDAVKLTGLNLPLPLEVLEIRAQGESAFDSFIVNAIESNSGRCHGKTLGPTAE